MTVLKVSMPRRLLVTTALPYANGPFHIGPHHGIHPGRHLGCGPAHARPRSALHRRRRRSRRADLLAAEKAGKSPEQFIAETPGAQSNTSTDPIEFDNWHSTHSKKIPRLSQDIYRKLDKRGGLQEAVEQFFDPGRA